MVAAASDQLRGEELGPGQQIKKPGAESDFDRQQIGDPYQERGDREFEARGERSKGGPRLVSQHIRQVEGQRDFRRKKVVVVEAVQPVDQGRHRDAGPEGIAAQQFPTVEGESHGHFGQWQPQPFLLEPALAQKGHASTHGDQEGDGERRPCHQRQRPGCPGNLGAALKEPLDRVAAFPARHHPVRDQFEKGVVAAGRVAELEKPGDKAGKQVLGVPAGRQRQADRGHQVTSEQLALLEPEPAGPEAAQENEEQQQGNRQGRQRSISERRSPV